MIPTPHATPREALIAWRHAIAYTQPEVAVLFGVSKGAVGWWESGRCPVPRRVQVQLQAEGWLPAGRTRWPWTPADDQRLRRLVAQGLSYERMAEAFARAHQPRTPESLRTRMHRLRLRAGDARRAPPPVHHGPQHNAWTAEQDAWLRAHAGTAPVAVLAEWATAACGVPRTAIAIKKRLFDLQTSALSVHLSVQQVARYCGMSRVTVTKWIRRGWLVLPAWAAKPRYGEAIIPRNALHQFITDYAYHLILDQMPPSVYRDQAAAIWQRERWLMTRQAAAYAGLTETQIRYAFYRGTLPAVRAHRQNAKWAWLVRTRDLMVFLRARDAARAPGRAAVGA